MINLFRNEKLNKINASWIFEYIIVIVYMVIGFIGWHYSYSISCFIMTLMTILLLFIFNDFKYMIPAILVLIFSYGGGYESDKLPVSIVGYAILLIVIILLFTIVNFKKSNLKKPKSFIGIIILAISCMIPIFWNNVITSETQLLYFIYFTWLLYIVVYFIIGINVNKRTLRFFIFNISWLAVLISIECVFKIRETALEYPDYDLLSLSYYLGWGLCNEAGLMLCFAMPFIFYEMVKSDNSIISLFSIAKIGIVVIGIFVTTSRGAYLFGSIELILLTILMIIFSKKRITNIVFLLLFALLAVTYVQLNYGIIELINQVIDKVFYAGLGDSGRFELWKRAYNCWNNNMVTRIFGSGIVSELEVRSSFNGDDLVYIVYHSTFFEILCSCGIIGVIGLLIHFFEKYKQLFKKDKTFLWIFGIGYLVVDLYGMIDNSFGMYYYMVPLLLFMAILDNDKNTDIFNNKYIVESQI